MARNDRAKRTKKALEAQRRGQSALPKGFTGRAKRAANKLSQPVSKEHRRLRMQPGVSYAYQGKVTAKRRDGSTVNFYTGAYNFMGSKPSLKDVQDRIAHGAIDNANENGSDIEIIDVELVNAWEAEDEE